MRVLTILFYLVLSGCATVQFSKYKAPQPLEVTNGITVQVGQIKDERGFSDPKAIRFNVSFDKPVADVIREALILELQGAGYSTGESDVLVSGVLTSFGTVDPCSLTISVDRGTPVKRVFSKSNEYRGREPTSIYDWDAAILDKLKQCVVQFANDYQLRVALGISEIEKFAQTNRKQISSDVDTL